MVSIAFQSRVDAKLVSARINILSDSLRIIAGLPSWEIETELTEIAEMTD
jgi:hypothetical protein